MKIYSDPKGICYYYSQLCWLKDVKTHTQLKHWSCYHNRNLMGEDLAPLSSKELESLERQLAVSLKLIRSTRVLARTYQLTRLYRFHSNYSSNHFSNCMFFQSAFYNIASHASYTECVSVVCIRTSHLYYEFFFLSRFLCMYFCWQD